MSVNHSASASTEKKTSAQLDSTFQELLRVKDEITSKLLEETKKSSDLAHLQSSVEEQLRDGFESSLQTIKTEFVKRRKKLVPVVKQLETASASLCKAERALQQYNRNSNSNIRKCNQRFKAARQVLMECSHNTDLFSNIQRYINDEIAFLREKLLVIPTSVSRHMSELLLARRDRDTPLDSDSDMSVDGEVFKPKPEYELANETNLPKPAKSVSKQNITTTPKSNVFPNLNTKTSQLNGVDLFTSDSDSLDEYFDTGSYRPIGPFNKQQPADNEQTKPRQTWEDDTCAFNSFTEAHYADAKVANVNSFESIDWQRAMESEEQNSTLAVNKNSNIQVGQPLFQLNIPQRASRRDQAAMTPSPRVNQKRYLPILPTKTSSDETPRSSKRSGKTLMSNDPLKANTHTSCKLGEGHVLKSDIIDYSLDVEEIQFKETVKTTSQQIIDKIKSKCTATQVPKYQSLTSTMNLDDTATLLAPCSSIFSESLDSTLTSVKDSGVDMKDSNFKLLDMPCEAKERNEEIHTTLSDVCTNKDTSGDKTYLFADKCSSEYSVSNNRNSTTNEPIYNWKRVEVFKRCENEQTYRTKDTGRSVSLTDTHESKVSVAIKKYETTSNSKPAFTPRHTRSRSATGPRMKYDNSFVSNRALQPRGDAMDHSLGGKTMSDNSRLDTDNTVDGMMFNTDESILSKTQPTTGSDLQQICARESRKAIRETWRYRRRSHSMTPRVPRNSLKTSTTCEFVGCFMLPSHGSKCNVSGLAVLSDGHVVALDEVHCYLVLFDSCHKYISQYNTVDVPSGITSMSDTRFAISYPFRFKIGIFQVQNGTIAHERDIHVKCRNWLTDVCFVHNTVYALCKEGHIHILNQSGDETKRLIVGVNGKLVINETAKRIYVIGTEQITRFDSDGNEMSRRMDISAFHAILISENLHVGDRKKHRLVPLSDSKRANCFTIDKVEFPCAMALYQDLLFISSFDETLSVEAARTIKVYRLRK